MRQSDPLDHLVVCLHSYLHEDRLRESHGEDMVNLKICMVSVDVNVESAQRKCQDLYVVRSQTLNGISWHLRSVAVYGSPGKTLMSTEEPSMFETTTQVRVPIRGPEDPRWAAVGDPEFK